MFQKRANRIDLFVRTMRFARDPESERVYGAYDAADVARWTVNCRNSRVPRRTALPLCFSSRADAERAMRGLIRAGLATDAVLYQRIKVDHDWNSVRRIMIESLNW